MRRVGKVRRVRRVGRARRAGGEEGVEDVDVFDDCGPAAGIVYGFGEIDDNVEGEENGVVEEVLYLAEEVGELAVARERAGCGEGVLKEFEESFGDFEVGLGTVAEVLELGRGHGGDDRGGGGKKGIPGGEQKNPKGHKDEKDNKDNKDGKDGKNDRDNKDGKDKATIGRTRRAGKGKDHKDNRKNKEGERAGRHATKRSRGRTRC